MPTLSIPNTFVPNTTAQASKVNANFSAVAAFFNSTKIDNSNIQTQGILGSNIALNTITGDRLNSNVVDGVTLTYNTNTIGVADGGVGLTQLVTAVANALCPIGTILSYAGTVAPNSNWQLCHGQAISRTTFSAYFSVVGIAYGGGDGSTTFNVPDTRGLFLRGLDDSTAARDPDSTSRTTLSTVTGQSLGNTGRNIGSFQADQFKSHTHAPEYGKGVQSLNAQSGSGITLQGNGVPASIGNTGGNQTNPKNLYVEYIVRVQ